MSVFLTGAGPLIGGQYTRLNYIQSSGTQYIDTGITGKSGIKIVMDVETVDVSTTQSFFGSQYNNGQRFSVNILNGKFEMQFNTEYGESTTTCAANTRYTLEANFVYNSGYLKVNGSDVQTRTGSSGVGSYNWYVFARNNGGNADRKASLKLYSMKIYDNDVLVRDFVPRLDNSDNEIGLYDKVNSVFYSNIGTGTFVGG